MSFCTPNAFPPRVSEKDFIFRLYLDGTRPLFKGLTVWEKIKDQIGSKNYSLIIFKEGKCPSFAVLINKRALERELIKNNNLFKKHYGEHASVELILDSLSQKKSYQEIATTPLFKSDLLLGVSLGFGRHNAELFQRREEITYSKECITKPQAQNGFLSNKDELEFLWAHLQPTSKGDDVLLRVTQVAFAGDPHDPETSALVKKYSKTHRKLISIFEKEDWLSIVLNQLAL